MKSNCFANCFAIGALVCLAGFAVAQELEEPSKIMQEMKWTSAECEEHNLRNYFPNLIVEKVLVDAGVNPGQIAKINQELGAAVQEYRTEDEIDDPMSIELAMEEKEHLQLTIYANIMRNYIDDAQVMLHTFQEIKNKRKNLIESCLQR